jgi:hypothetical protein
VRHVTRVLPTLINPESLITNVLHVVTFRSPTFPMLPNEEFTYNYNEKRGVDLEFGLKKKSKKKDNDKDNERRQ